MFLGGLSVEADRELAGCRMGVLVGTKLRVSPALFSLLSSETGESLRRVLDSMSVIDLTCRPYFDVVLPPCLAS